MGTWGKALLCAGATLAALSITGAATAQDVPSLSSLKGVPVPEPAALGNFVKDRQMARVLGKALFWDMAVGSDGVMACASCHFHAGVDNRVTNQLGPALNHTAGAPTSSTFSRTKTGGNGGPNYTVRKDDFPFRLLSKTNDRNSSVVFDTNDVMSSQGVAKAQYAGHAAGDAADQCVNASDAVFHVGSIGTRRVEPRNAPTTINAAFNFRNFWDGRANNIFNGVNVFGPRDPNARIYVADAGGVLSPQVVALENASLASQAVGPPTSDFEMSCANRTFPALGNRLTARRALATQKVDAADGVLGAYRDASGVGLASTYGDLIRAAFWDKYWNSPNPVSIGGRSYAQVEANFSLFFGLALQMYQSQLVSDDAPIDRYYGGDSAALDDLELRGMGVFLGKGNCIACHHGPQLTSAGTPSLKANAEAALIERMTIAGGAKAHYDFGFYNIGVRPTVEDLGVGAADPFGRPLSFTRQYKDQLQSGTPFVDRFRVDPCTFDVDPCKTTPAKDFREAVDGAFKVPTLRNVELTGPYFHNGGQATLEQVVEFYSRGGDRKGGDKDNSTGFGSIKSNLDAEIKTLKLSDAEKDALAAFLKRPLTDDRVRCDRAPFDHPQLFVANGHVGSEVSVSTNASGSAMDKLVEVPAVGAQGFCSLAPPRKAFIDTLPN